MRRTSWKHKVGDTVMIKAEIVQIDECDPKKCYIIAPNGGYAKIGDDDVIVTVPDEYPGDSSMEDLTYKEIELRPCPFCGHLPSMENGYVYCNNVDCGNIDPLSPRDWNTRPVEDELAASLAAMTEERNAARAELERCLNDYDPEIILGAIWKIVGKPKMTVRIIDGQEYHQYDSTLGTLRDAMAEREVLREQLVAMTKRAEEAEAEAKRLASELEYLY